jgi:plastocyanin
MRKTSALIAVCALAAFGLGACGGSDDSGDSGGTSTTSAGGGGGGGGGAALSLSADPSGALAYDTDSLSASAGDVTIDFDNPAQLGHDVCLKDSSGNEIGCSDTITHDSTTLDAGNLKAGDYTFYCSVDGHEAAGMEGTLKVK